MSPEKKIFQERYLHLLKADASDLFDRIHARQTEYIESYSLLRERTSFTQVFENRYSKATLYDLSHLPSEIIELAHDFYSKIDAIYWYLMHTQDMPNTIQDTISKKLGPVKKKFETLIFYIDAELGHIED